MSILLDVKQMIGISEDANTFDNQLIPIINSVLNDLTELGIGPKEGYIITGNQETWDNLLGNDKRKEQVKLYVGLKTRLIFDTPTNSSMLKVVEEELQRLEWRIVSLDYQDKS